MLGGDDERALHLDPGIVDGRLEQAAPALLRVEIGRNLEARRRDLEILPRPPGRDLVGHDQDRTLQLLLRSPIASEFFADRLLARFAFLDQSGDEDVREKSREREAADQRQLVQ